MKKQNVTANASHMPNITRNVNFRPEVYDLIQGECALRRNGGKGFSLTVNQIVLDYFELSAQQEPAIIPVPASAETEAA